MNQNIIYYVLSLFSVFYNPCVLYVSITWSCSIPSIIISTLSLLKLNDLSCHTGLWMVQNISFCSVNIILSLYIWIRFTIVMRNGDHTPVDRFDVFKRIVRLDPIIAVYSVFLVAFFVWLCAWTNRYITDESIDTLTCYNDDDDDDDDMDDRTARAFICLKRASEFAFIYGYCFFGVGLLSLCCLDCWMCCDSGDGHILHDPLDDATTVAPSETWASVDTLDIEHHG